MTSPYRPPSCDKLNTPEQRFSGQCNHGVPLAFECHQCEEDKRPKLKECPSCGGKNVEIPRGLTWVICRNSDCNSEGPINDPQGHKWNSIPRCSEVAELLRLVDEVTSRMEHEELERHANKLRKGWGL